MHRQKQQWIWDLLWLAAIYVWMAAFSSPYFFHAATESLRQFQSYNLDSADAIRAVQNGLHSRFFRLTFNDYGHFYSNLSMAVATLYSAVAELTDHALINILRLNALVGGACAITVTYVFARRYLGRPYAMLASGILAFSPALLTWSNELKPDSWQLTFIILSIYFLARAWEEGDRVGRALVPPLPPARFRFVVAASAAAGAAFGSKYLGMFLLPLVGISMLGVGLEQITERHLRIFRRLLDILALPLALLFGAIAVLATPARLGSKFSSFSPTNAQSSLLEALLAGRVLCALFALLCVAVLLRRLLPSRWQVPERATRLVILCCATAGAFWVTFFLTSPWLFYRLAFVREILIRSHLVEDYKPFGLLNWLQQLLWDGTYVGYATAVMAVAGLAWLAVSALRSDWRKTNLAYIPVWGFGFIFVTLLVVKVNRATVLYGMPVTPLLALLAAYFLWRAVPYIAGWVRLSPNLTGTLLAIALVIVAAIEGVPSLMAYPLLVTDMTPENRQLGRWLSACLPVKTGILGASYSYVPPAFHNFIGGDGKLYFDRINPSVVILNKQVRDEVKAGPQPPTSLMSTDRTKLYRLLEGWQMGPVFGVLQVYWRPDVKLSPACSQQAVQRSR